MKSSFKRTMIIIMIIMILFIIVLGIMSYNQNKLPVDKMVCKSSTGSITLTFTVEELLEYDSNKIDYDFKEQKKYAEEIGIDAYLDEYSNWFSNNTDGECIR